VAVLTYKFRIKDASSKKHLDRHAKDVNFVWNFSKETQIKALKKKSAKIIHLRKEKKDISGQNWLDRNDFHALTKGASRELNLHSQTIQGIYEEYITRRIQFKKLLRWRGKKAPGWIPFKASGIKLLGDRVSYQKRTFKLWKSRELPSDAVITNGNFSEDSRGRWYISITFKTDDTPKGGEEELGVDLGIKTLATLSDGSKINRPDLRVNYLKRIRSIERTRKYARRKQAKTKRFGKLPKAKQMAKVAAKVANQRKDHLHKESRRLVSRSKVIVMGDLKCRFMNRNRSLSGISLDCGIGLFKGMLHYKAVGAGVTFKAISERDSTQTCSSCGWQHPKESRIGLGVREWSCPSCGEHHDRDVNAAKVILRMGHHTPARAV
jgi:transposase